MPPGTNVAGGIPVGAGVGDKILPAVIRFRPRLEETTRGAGVTQTTVVLEVGKGAPARAVVVHTRTLAKEILRALTPWKIPCQKVASGMRRARSAREMTAGPESVKVAVTTARRTTGVTTGPTARMSDTRTSSPPLSIFTKCGRAERQLSCDPLPTLPKPRVTTPTAIQPSDYLGLRGQTRPG